MNLPNRITLSRIMLIPVFIVVFFLDVIPQGYNYLVAAIVFAAAAFTDFLDGHIARSRGLVTNLGKFLDPIADKVLVSTALILILVRGNAVLQVLWAQDWVLFAAGCCVAVILARELIVSGFRMVAASAGLVLAADKVGKFKTVFQDIAVIFLLVGAVSFGSAAAGEVLNGIGLAALAIATVLTIWSGISYIVRNRAVLQEKKGEESKA